MTYGAVLFDLDGTLLDTVEDLADAMNAALGQLGCPPRSVAECKRFVGDVGAEAAGGIDLRAQTRKMRLGRASAAP